MVSSHSLIALIAVTLPLSAQGPSHQNAASSKSAFMTSSSLSSGGTASSTGFQLVCAIDGAAGLTGSANYQLAGHWTAQTVAKTLGVPWCVAATPLFGQLGGRSTHTLRGTEMHLGQSASCAVGGVAATVVARTRATATIKLGAMNTPGWHALRFANGGGSSTLSRGIGVKPMLDVPQPAWSAGGWGSNKIRYYGTSGEFTIWMLSLGEGPPIPLPGFGYSFRLNVASLLMLWSSPVPPSGIVDLPLPPMPVPPLLRFQVFTLKPPTYFAGSFTNVVKL